jgi:outer membrane protein assembly factor BamB
MSYSLAVVPIFVNAGTALVPALLAGAASVGALFFKPRELLAACRRRPMVPVVVVIVAGGIWMGVSWWGGEGVGKGEGVREGGITSRDWIKIAGTLPPPTTRKPPANTTETVFRHTYNRCGFSGGAEPVGLKRLWDYNPNGDWVLSSPLVVGNRIFAATSFQDVDARTYGTVYCLDVGARHASPVTKVWEVAKVEGKAMKGFFSSPALTADGKYLVIGQGLHDDADSDLLCFEAISGKLHWRIKTPLHIESSPAIRGDLVVAGVGAIEGADHKPRAGTDPGFVLAVRISDGKELWRHAVNDPESSPAIGADGTVYIGSGFEGKAVVALRSETDEELKRQGLERVVWRTPAAYPVTGAVTLVDDLVIVGAGNSDFVFEAPNPAGLVMALEAKTGQVKWKREFPDAVLGAVAARDGVLICPVRSGEVVALNAADGSVIWRTAVSGKAPVLAGPAFTGRYVYAVSRDGYLVVLDAKDGKQVERHLINHESNPGEAGLSISSPMVAGGCVFVGSETGGVRCFVGQ